MKTSNKLLIVLAISLIVIPIIVFAINVKMNYKTVEASVAATKNIEHFATPSEGYLRTEISKPFNTINIEDATDFYLNVRLVKDIRSGVKIPEEYKNQVKYHVDENGILQISLNKPKNNEHAYAYIVIYSSTVNQLSCSRGKGLGIRSNADVLSIDVSDMHSLTFEAESKLNDITVSARKIGEIILSKTIVGNIKLSLENSDFKTDLTSYKSLIINAKGESNIEINGGSETKDKHSINDLSIITAGNSTLNVNNIKINKLTGSLSDSTVVSMPTSYLKQIFKQN